MSGFEAQNQDLGNANLTSSRPITIPRIAPEGTTYGAVATFAPRPFSRKSTSHDMNGENATLVAGKQVIDEIPDNRVGFVSELCHHPTDKRAAPRVPLQIDRSVKISSTVYFRPAMRAARLLMPDFDESKFLLKLRIAHDLVS
jgi:hypothetical protein